MVADNLVDLTSDELRIILEHRAQKALTEQTGPALGVSQNEWELLKLHRVAQQYRIVGRGIVAPEPDPLRELNAVAIVVLRSLKEELEGEVPLDAEFLFKVFDRWLGILGADGNESGPASSGPGR